MACTVDDVLSRRTRARLLARDASAAAADDVAALLAAELGWSRRRTPNARSTRYRALVGRGTTRGRAARRRRSTPSRTRRRDSVVSPRADEPGRARLLAIAFGPGEIRDHLRTTRVEVDAATLDRLRATGAEVYGTPTGSAAASRDWWPLAMIWALDAQVAARASVVVAPHDAAQVQAVLSICNAARVPVTAAAGRSGVCGASVPVFGGVLLDLTRLTGVVSVDPTSMLVDVRAGTFGDVFEDELREQHGVTCGHWPQSMALSTVGGWVACRGAGQLSTRYGKIEDIVEGLDVVLADGTLVHTGGAPRAAVGPDLAPGLPRLRGNPRHRRRRAAPRASPAGVGGARRVRVRVVRRRPRHDAPDRPARRDTGGAAPVRRDRSRPQLSHRRRAPAADARRGRRAHHRGDPADRRRGVHRRGRRPRPTSRSSSSGSATATTSPRSRP